ncbi:MAG: SusC/RagA family TonB-linked outer membrane protein [Ignavibacteriales bacterium]|nr:SusC/RagA family TonB-linked outer membrane protein [Ignavibacteriales bacterium]
MRKLCWYFFVSLVVLVFAASFALAQIGTVKGTITDAQTGEALVGANVFLEKTSFGAATDVNGVYTILNVLQGNYTLVVSYIGYEPYRKAISVKSDRTTTLDIKLNASAVTLSGVVVTAIGTRVEREKMGTSVSSVNAASLATVGVHDVVTSLEAKGPGIQTLETTSDPGGSTKIVLRGLRSLSNSGQPLFVVDGVPVFSGNSIGGAVGGGNQGVAAESRLNDINPDDIESIEVFKGPSASALWGSRAANGVIVITTKSGGQTGSKKLSVTVHSKTYADQLLRPYPLQSRFGQGIDGVYGFNAVRSWGDPIWLRSGAADSLQRTNYAYPTILKKNSTATFDHATDILRDNAVTADYGVTLRGGDEWSDFYLDFSQLNQTGIYLTNSDLHRTSIRANATRRFTENIIAKVTASYVKSSTKRIQQGSNTSGIALGGYRTPPDFNANPYLVDFISPTGTVTLGVQRTYRNSSGNPALGPGFDNPLYIINYIPTLLNTDRLLGTAELTYEPAKWLNVIYRAGADYYTDRQFTTFPPGTATNPTGATYRAANTNYMLNSDILATANQELMNDISGTLTVGFHLDHRRSDGTTVNATAFVLLDAPATFSNSLNYTPGEGLTITRSAAVYSEASLELFKQVYLRGTGRMESASTYGPDAKQTYFYPSASVAWQFSEFPFIKENLVKDASIFSFGKLRFAYGEAANQPGAYQTKTYFGVANPGNGWGEGLRGTQYTGGGTVRSASLGNSLLGPEMTSETEFGADLRFLNDRISFSGSMYLNKTTDALLAVSVAASSGYTSRTANAAKLENKGTELQLIAEWLRIEPFSWTTTVNWSQNFNKVTDLSGVTNVGISGFVGAVSSAVLNQPVGVMFGTRWARNPDGSLMLDVNKFAYTDAVSGVIGDPNPIWRSGIINTLRYERLTLNVVVDISRGGKNWNGTKGALYSYGTDKDMDMWTTITAAQASSMKTWSGKTPATYIAASATQKRFYTNADGTVSFRGKIGNFGGPDVILDQDWYNAGPGGGINGAPTEEFMEDASYVKLREVSLSYTFPLRYFGMQSATVSVTGRNLAIWTDYTGVDPETNLGGSGTNGLGIDYFNNPTTKTWIVSLQIEY